MKPMMPTLKVILISCILLSCTSGGDTSKRRNQGPVYIAIVAPFSGPLSEFGRSMLRGGRMRMEEGRDQILINGRAAKLIALDDRGEAEQAIRLAKDIAGNQSIVAVIGHVTTGCTLSAIPVYNAARLIHISPVATGDDLEGIKSPYTFRTVLTESQQAMSLADYMCRAIDGKKVALIYEDTPLGYRMRKSFLSRSEEIGLSVRSVLVEGNPFPDPTEMMNEVATLRAEAIFLAGGARLGGMVVRRWPKKIERPLIFGIYRLVSEEFMEVAGKHSKGILAAHPCVWRSDFEKGRGIKDRYEREFRYIMDWLAIQTYDAVDLLLWAIRKSGVDPDSMRGALQGLDSEDSSMPGLAGPIYFNPNGSLARDVSVAICTGSGWKLREGGK